MPTRDIRTTLTVDGDKKFAKAMKDAAQEMRVLKSELGEISAEFKETNDAQTYFAKRGDVLKREIAKQEETINLLNEALKDSIDTYGKASREANGYRIQLNNAQAKMHDLRRASQQADKEMEEFGRDSKKVGRQIADGIGDGVEEAADGMDGMFSRISDGLESLKGMAGVQIGVQVASFVVDAAQALGSFVADNADLNRQMSFAKYNVEKAGFNWEEINKLAIRATAVTGDYETALEGISHLAQVGFKDADLVQVAVDALTGVSIMTGNALTFESLSESFRESIKTKAPTGAYAEAIEAVMGEAAVDEITKAFEGAKTPEDLIHIALGYLTEGGAQTAREEWETKNAEFISYQEKQIELSTKWAELATELTPIVTAFTDGMVTVVDAVIEWVKDAKEAIEWFNTEFNEKIQPVITGAAEETAEGANLANDLVEQKNKQEAIKAAGGELAGLIYEGAEEKLAEELGSFEDIFGRGYDANMEIVQKYDLTAPGVAEIVDQIEALTEVMQTDTAEAEILRNTIALGFTGANIVSEGKEAFVEQNPGVAAFFGGFGKGLGSFWSGMEFWVNPSKKLDEWFGTKTKAEEAKIIAQSVAELYEMVGTSDDWQNRSRADTLAMFEGYDLTNTDVLLLKNAVEEWYSIFGDGTETAMENAATTAETGGENFGLSFGNGILKAQPQVMRNLAMMLGGINSVLNQPAGVPSYSVFSGAGGGNPNQTASNRGMAVLEIDGHTAGRLLYGGVSEEGARRTRTMITVG